VLDAFSTVLWLVLLHTGRKIKSTQATIRRMSFRRLGLIISTEYCFIYRIAFQETARQLISRYRTDYYTNNKWPTCSRLFVVIGVSVINAVPRKVYYAELVLANQVTIVGIR